MEASTPARLTGLKVALDVQHLWKPPPHDKDRGSEYTLADGTHVTEGHAALLYAAACAAWLRARGAETLENQPGLSMFVGTYGQRNRAALAWGAHCYLACHLNAGGGSYGLFEWLGLNPGEELASWLGAELVKAVPEVHTWKSVALHHGDRGVVCVEACSTMAAVIAEPFFGDAFVTQKLLQAGNLIRIGEALGAGVAAWWESKRPAV